MKTLVAVAQMCTTKSKAENLSRAFWLMEQASRAGASLIGLPENFAFLGENERETAEAAEFLDGATITAFKARARDLKIWVSLGGFQEKTTTPGKIHNTHVVIDHEGNVQGVYRKMHLFSVTLPDGSVFNEASAVVPGRDVVTTEAPFAKLGLSICYDVRFPLLYQALRTDGAEVMLVPAAFSPCTGPAHWEILLRARAIETQSYVLAAAQAGRHNAKRSTHGHAMIIDPWGTILAQCGLESHMALGEIDIAFAKKLRADMPVEEQRVLEPVVKVHLRR